MTDLALWQWALVFVVATAVLVLAGVALAKAGDEIATRTGLGGLVVGMLLTAAATSLPEVVTVMSASAAGAADLAVGSIFGSSMGNMAILAVIDLVHRRHFWAVIELGHARVAAVAIALTALAVLGVASPKGLAVGWVGGDTLLIAVVYAAAAAWVRRVTPVAVRAPAEEYPQPTESGEAEHPGAGLRSALIRFGLATLAIFIAGPIVALSGERIAEISGISETFVGVAFVAVATSLPELAASLGAVRIGAYDLAVGNLFGSNAFNMVVLVLADAVYTEGALLGAAAPAQVVGGVAAILLMAVALALIVHGEETRISRLEPDAALLLVVYVGALVAVWAASA